MFKKTIGNGVKGAFTLAEVLITLGIIGVVAAMTMPTLINSTQGAQYKTAYKKALSVMSQAVVMNIALDDYDLSQTVAGKKNGKDADGVQSIYSLFKNRMNVVKVAKGSDFEAATDLHDTSGSKNYTIVSVPEESANDYTKFATLHSPTAKNTFPAITQGGTWPGETTLLFFNDGITANRQSCKFLKRPFFCPSGVFLSNLNTCIVKCPKRLSAAFLRARFF